MTRAVRVAREAIASKKLQRRYKNVGNSLKSSVASKSLFVFQYFCDDDDFIITDESAAAIPDNADTTTATLYQRVDVILRTTTCNNYDGNTLKHSVASKPLFVYQCFCDDDDFIINDESPTTAAAAAMPDTDTANTTVNAANAAATATTATTTTTKA